jgi:hypothetical protein
MQDEIRDAALPSSLGQTAMDALDDVIALAELAERLLRIPRELPLGGAESTSKTERLELAHSADLDGAELVPLLATLWPQIDYAATRRSITGKRSVKRGPALRPNLRFQ